MTKADDIKKNSKGNDNPDQRKKGDGDNKRELILSSNGNLEFTDEENAALNEMDYEEYTPEEPDITEEQSRMLFESAKGLKEIVQARIKLRAEQEPKLQNKSDIINDPEGLDDVFDELVDVPGEPDFSKVVSSGSKEDMDSIRTRKLKIRKLENLKNRKINFKDSVEGSLNKTKKEDASAKSISQNDKINFINKLIPGLKTVDEGIKDKFFTLVGKELERIPEMESRIMKELEELKKIISEKTNEKTDEKRIEKKEFLHNPLKTVEFLRLFEGELKYFTHKWEKDTEFKRLEEVKKAVIIINNYKKIVPSDLWFRVKVFLTKNLTVNKPESDPEWFVNYLFGKKFICFYSWDNQKFVNWFNSSITKDITAPEINDNMIEPFKNSIQIRDGNLIKHIDPIIRNVSTELFPTYLNLEQAKFYTDIQGLMGGIRKIFESSVLKYAKKNEKYKVQIEYDDKRKCIKIIHFESTCILNSDSKDLFGGDLKSIRDSYFKGICNWSIEAAFSDGAKRINFLNDNKEINYIDNLEETPKGFTHLLYFY